MNELPEEIHNVSMGFFSIARYYGGIKFQGVYYAYDPTRDVLVRDDVLKARAKAEREKKKAKKAAKGKNKGLFEGDGPDAT